MYIHVLMRDEKEERNKKARSNKQGKATHHFSMYIHSHILAVAGTGAHYVGHMHKFPNML